jgi:hypothetical protein
MDNMKLCPYCWKAIQDDVYLCTYCKHSLKENYNSESFDYHHEISNSDYIALKHVMWPFIHAKEPSTVQIPEYPSHLSDHPLVNYINKYKNTADKTYLDKAGQILCPTSEPFGWYVALTK